MATKVELPKEIVRQSLELRIQSTRRAAKAATNKLVAEAYTSEADQITAALGTITEVK